MGFRIVTIRKIGDGDYAIKAKINNDIMNNIMVLIYYNVYTDNLRDKGFNPVARFNENEMIYDRDLFCRIIEEAEENHFRVD